jgi:hypothetical protein
MIIFRLPAVLGPEAARLAGFRVSWAGLRRSGQPLSGILIEKTFGFDGGDERLPRVRRILQPTAVRILGIPDCYPSAQGRHLNARPVSHASPGLTPLEVANLRIGQRHQTSNSLRNSRIAESPTISVVLYGVIGDFINREFAAAVKPPLNCLYKLVLHLQSLQLSLLDLVP